MNEPTVRYANRIFEVVSYDEKGGIKDFANVVHPGAVAAVAHDDEFVYLTSQYRPAVDRRVLELPAGTMEPGEDPVMTIDRELQEEIGKGAQFLNLIGNFYSSPGYTDEKVILWRAWGLYESKREGDADEDIEIVPWPLREINDALKAPTTAKTIIGLMKLKEVLVKQGRAL